MQNHTQALGASRNQLWLQVVVVLAISTAAFGQKPAPHTGEADRLVPSEQFVIIRVYGSILYSTKHWGGEGALLAPLTTEQIDGWMKKCADNGVTTVLWRANCAGTLTYPSKFTGLAGEPPLPDPNEGMGVASVKQGWALADWQWLGEQCKRFNTLEAAVTAAHKHGLKFYLDFNTFDMVGSWCSPKTWPDGGDQNWDPDMWLWSKDQNRRLAGVPCYFDPKVRARRLAELAEALEYDLDGVALGFFSHCDGMSGEDRCAFGYNPVVVSEYKKRHQVDLLTEDVDTHRFYALHGEGFTEFVRGASKLVHKKGKKLICSTRTDGIHGWGGSTAALATQGETMRWIDLRDGKSELPLAAGFYLETEKWAQERLVDGLLCNAPYTDGVQVVRKLRDRVELPVYLWRDYTGYQGKVLERPLESFLTEVQEVRNGVMDGYCILVMQIIDHPNLRPDWTVVYAK